MANMSFNVDNYEADMIDDELPEEVMTPHKPRDEISDSFQEAIRDARDLEQQLLEGNDAKKDSDAKKEARQRFVNDHLDSWKRKTHEKMNFLHFFAHYDHGAQPSLNSIMARAIMKMPAEMGMMDDNRFTPLTLALSRNNFQFIFAVCKNVPNTTKQSIGDMLRSECEGHDIEPATTCLHEAVSWNRRQNYEFVKTIVDLVPEAMFSVRDSKGRTPLHLAVEYDRCCADQVKLVEQLLRRGPAAMNVRISGDVESLTAYQYHVKTRTEADDKWRARDHLIQREGSVEQGAKDYNDAESRKEKVAALKSANLDSGNDRMEPPAPRHVLIRRDSFCGSPAPTPPGSDNGEFYYLDSMDRRPHQVERPQGASVETGKSLHKPQTVDINLEKKEERRRSSEEIESLLKLFCLRRMRPQEAVAHLHIRNQRDKELWFDLGEKRMTDITSKEFQGHFEHLEFDKALHYVAIPQLEPTVANDNLDERYRGREDLLSIFKWLSEKKGVKRIIRVEIDDMLGPGHSDGAIEKALEKFQVEVLDWRRQDLCPFTISRIGGSLREVHLQWSGRNTVLRSWSEREGLALTPSLEKICINQAEGLESEERTKTNLNQFEDRLLNSWPEQRPKPDIVRPRSGGGRRRHHITRTSDGLEMTPKQERYVDPHQWMQCMEEFASHFRQIRGIRKKMTDESLNPVIVALIDDGADITHSELKGKESLGKSFDLYNNGWRVSPFWSSASGHGTLMARLIHRICPSATIYVIKLRTVETANSVQLQIDPRSAIQAIECAAEHGAQIISMSWATKRPENEYDRVAFDKAIRKAHNKNILMFCSAIDKGKFQEFTYPHASNPQFTFKIGAAKATGVTAENVNEEDLDFVFPGHEVFLGSPYEDLSDKRFEGFESHTGSSVATALASGLAALVLECVRLSHISTLEGPKQTGHGAIDRADMDKIRKREALESAFSYISGGHRTDSKYIEVWKTFTEFGEDLKRNAGASTAQLNVIRRLARRFLMKTD